MNTTLPPRHRDLQIRPLATAGQYVAKNLTTGRYFHLGEQERFLLQALDGKQSVEAICMAFELRFGQPLSDADLQDFLDLARQKGLVEHRDTVSSPPAAPATEPSAYQRPRRYQNILYWRIPLFDPDRLCNYLEPRLRLLWTSGFVIAAVGAIVLAMVITGLNSDSLATAFANQMQWQAIALIWLTMALVTLVHEFAHALTCKHYGGEVHEMGFLLIFFMPCFYCNVSDAWLFAEKSKRLCVTFAGAFSDLVLGSLAIITWRLTMTDNLINYVSLNIASVCGVRTIFNLNPLLKLDGYYLLSDVLEVPNLQSRSLSHFKSHLRHLLWGAPSPIDEAHSRLFVGFGLATFTYSALLLGLMLWALSQYVQSKAGWLGFAAVAVVGLVSGRGLIDGLSAGEARKMISARHKRTASWLLLFAGAAAVLGLFTIEDCTSGSFVVRPRNRAEIRAPLSGFVQAVHFDQGERISAGGAVVQLDMPNLSSRITKQEAGIREAQARLRLLESGARQEEIDQQRRRVERMTSWRDLAKQDLIHARLALKQELSRLDQQVAQYRAELESANDAQQRAKALFVKGVVAVEERREAERRYQVAHSQVAQAESQKRQREALGTREAIAGLDAEAELARREKDLADADATLELLRLGTRTEELDAARAGIARLTAELQYLKGVRDKEVLASPVAGIVTTPRIKEKVGQYVKEGDLIAVVEQPGEFEIEIAVAEQEAAQIHVGQQIALKARALPFDTFESRVDRIAPTANRDQVQSQLTVYCRLNAAPTGLRSEMTGYARIYTGRRSLGEVLFQRVIRLLRTEFWW